MKIASEIYSQAGIKINWDYSVHDSPSGVDLLNGLQFRDTDKKMSSETKAIITHLGSDSDVSDLHVFYVNELKTIDASGVALPPFLVPVDTRPRGQTQ